MKAVSFLSIAFMAASAIAAPLQVVETTGVESVVKDVTNTAGGVVGGAVATVNQIARKQKREITDAAGFVSILEGVQSSLRNPLASLKDITDGVRSGEISKKDATSQAKPQLQEIQSVLKGVVSELTGASGIDAAGIDVTQVASLVNVVVAQLLTTVNDLVSILGIQAPLISILTSVIGLVARVLTLVVGLVTELVPGIVAGLTPLLAGIGSGVLVPLLTPIASFLAGI